MSDHQSGMPGIVKNSLWIIGIVVGFLILVTVYVKLTSKPEMGTATIGHTNHAVLIAKTPSARYQGLSGKTPETLGAEGMYFSFSDDAERTFSMRGMLFALDFIWVRDGKVVKVEGAVAAPAAGEQPKLLYSQPEKADGVFEFPAGFVGRNAIAPGDDVVVR